MPDLRQWFTPILRSSISRHQEGRCSGSSPAKKDELGTVGLDGGRTMAGCPVPVQKLFHLCDEVQHKAWNNRKEQES